MDNKRRKLFVIKQSKGCEFMPEMRQNKFGGWAPPGPPWGAYAHPQTPSRNGGLLLMEGGKGRILVLRGTEGR